MQPFSVSRHHCLANVPDRCSTGPAIPGVVSHESGEYWTYNSSSQPGGALSMGAPGMPIIAYTGSHRHPRSHPTTSGLHRPVIPELLSLSNEHSLTLGIQKYIRAFTVPLLYYPGFYRTAVLCLSEPHTTRDPHGSP